MGDLNNTAAMRESLRPVAEEAYQFRSFSIPERDDDAAVRKQYRPFILDDEITSADWTAKLELGTVAQMVDTEILAQGKDRLRVLVLYGSLRSRFEHPRSKSSLINPS
jgi:arsenic resistance protein ArsH